MARRFSRRLGLIGLAVTVFPGLGFILEPGPSKVPKLPERHVPRPMSVPSSGSGRLVVVRDGASSYGSGLHYVVEVESGLPVDARAFAERVERVLSDRRGWAAGGSLAFTRTGSGPADFRVALASPGTTDRLCAPLLTNGIYSCASDGRAVLNLARWAGGASSYGKELKRYRTYMVNHEVGHVLGHGHGGCPGAGARAPVMMQQTKGVAPCRPNPWPLAAER